MFSFPQNILALQMGQTMMTNLWSDSDLQKLVVKMKKKEFHHTWVNLGSDLKIMKISPYQ